MPDFGPAVLCTLLTCFFLFFFTFLQLFFSDLPVFVYEPLGSMSMFLATALTQALSYNPHVSHDPAKACLYLVPIGL